MGFLKKLVKYALNPDNAHIHEDGPITRSRTWEKVEKKLREEHGMAERNSFFDHATNKYATPEIGSVILCDLSPLPFLSAFGLNAEHTGIYVGGDEIIHRSGDGHLERVSPKRFLERLNGKNCAISVYVSCIGDRPLNDYGVSGRAIAALNDPEHSGYDILNKNCHHFTRYCLTGDTDQWGLDFTFSSLQQLMRKEFKTDNWRIWKYE